MKVLVAIANYGAKNIGYLNILINEYKSMPYDVDIVVLSDIPKEFGSGIEVIVGLPSKDPWSLPFGHKKLFAEMAGSYDLFIYSEDDILITEKNINAFLNITQILPEKEIAGFMRYEADPSGNRHLPDVFGGFHWVCDSVRSIGDYTFAYFTNLHAACYLLTQKQLKKAIASGGFLVDPHQGRYDLLCTAATDPYTQCGFAKMICISQIDDFLVHHLSNKHAGKVGLGYNEFIKQIDALLLIKNNAGLKKQLFKTETNLINAGWDKSYFEQCREDIIELIPEGAKSVLSVGCGWGATEKMLIEMGIRVAAVPLDSVIAATAADRGVELTAPDFYEALKTLPHQRFDCIIFSEILHHLADPVHILSEFSRMLTECGLIVGSAPNFNYIKNREYLNYCRTGNKEKMFDKYHLHFTTKKMVKEWLKKCGIKEYRIIYNIKKNYRWYSVMSFGLLDDLLASRILFAAFPARTKKEAI